LPDKAIIDSADVLNYLFALLLDLFFLCLDDFVGVSDLVTCGIAYSSVLRLRLCAVNP
jgi:hypothetical protein